MFKHLTKTINKRPFLSSFIPKFQIPSSRRFYLRETTPVQPTILNTSIIRRIDIGHNYFKHILPRRKKLLLILLESYIHNLSPSERLEFEEALCLFYSESYEIDKEQCTTMLVTEQHNNNFLWHIYSLFLMDNIASQYSRYEYLEYHQMIKTINSIPKETKRKSRFVFTSHPNQSNSTSQLKAINMIYKGLEQNDVQFLQHAMKNLIEANKTREFKKPTLLEESIVYHSLYLPNLIKAVAISYDFGLKNPAELIECPSTWITFDLERLELYAPGNMTFTHATVISITAQQYLNIINEIPDGKSHKNIKIVVDLCNATICYANTLMELSEKLFQKQICFEEFLHAIPIFNLFQIENKILENLNEVLDYFNKNMNVNEEYPHKNFSEKFITTISKLIKLIEVFHLYGCTGHLRLNADNFQDRNNIPQDIKNIFKEISILNMNSNAVDHLIIKDYSKENQFDAAVSLLNKYQLNLSIVPLLEEVNSTNSTNSEKSLMTSSKTRQRDGLILTELRVLLEYLKNPDKVIFLAQGTTAERGGGPFNLLHHKYLALTKSQRFQHIRTLQGHFLSSEFASPDLAFNLLINVLTNINQGDVFEPSKDYVKFLSELDKIIGEPQRQMWNSSDYNDFYSKNEVIKTLAECFDFTGSASPSRELTNIRKEKSLDKAYITSERCSFTHPELAFWNILDENNIKKIAKFYFENNAHFKYILYMYAFIAKRFDLEFAGEIMDTNNPVFKNLEVGKKSLVDILDYLGLGANSRNLKQIWNQNLGLLEDSSEEEAYQKEEALKAVNRIQRNLALSFLKRNKDDKESKQILYKIRVIQCALANMSPFCGKG